MGIKRGQFDLKRPKCDFEVTQNFHKQMRLMDKFGYGISRKAICHYLNLSKSSIIRWEKEQLIFPCKVNKNPNSQVRYRYKDIMRAFTIKFLMTNFSIRKFEGVRFVLEITNLTITPQRETYKSINNVRIDQFLMRTLNYNLEELINKRNPNSHVKKEVFNDSTK